MLEMLKYTVDEKFMKDASLELISVFSSSADLINYLEGYEGEGVDVKGLKYAFLGDEKSEK